MTDFNPLKAAQEVLASMVETRQVLVHMERELLDQYSNAERRLIHVRKIIGAFDAMLIEPQREKVKRLQDAQS